MDVDCIAAAIEQQSNRHVGVCKIAGQEKLECAEVQGYCEALMPHFRLVALGERHCCRLHQHMLQRRMDSLVSDSITKNLFP